MSLLVVAYDVADDRRRVRLHTVLLGFGQPVQESVFECVVDDRQTRDLKRRIRRTIRPGDKVRYYRLCGECAAAIEAGDGTPRTEAIVFAV